MLYVFLPILVAAVCDAGFCESTLPLDATRASPEIHCDVPIRHSQTAGAEKMNLDARLVFFFVYKLI